MRLSLKLCFAPTDMARSARVRVVQRKLTVGYALSVWLSPSEEPLDLMVNQEQNEVPLLQVILALVVPSLR